MDPGSLLSPSLRFVLSMFSALETRWLPAAPESHLCSQQPPKVSVSTVGGAARSQQAKQRRSLQRSSFNGSLSTPPPTRARLPSPEHLLAGESREVLRVRGKRDQALMPSSLQVPTSTCSKDCQPGQKKKSVGIHPCCFECLDCLPGTFLNKTEGKACRLAPTLPLPHPRGLQAPSPFGRVSGSP